MPTDYLTDLRTRRGFALPEVYTRLHAAGMLDWGAFGPQWQTAVLPGLLARPPLLLFADGFEGLVELLPKLRTAVGEERLAPLKAALEGK